MSEQPGEHRLDPDRAALDAARRAGGLPEPVIDTRPYRRVIGGIGLTIAVGVSAFLFITRGGVGTIGIPPGQRLHSFVAPLATSTLNGDANLNPRCNPDRPNSRALNVCPWFARRAPLVLGLFVPASGDCVRQIDTMQTVSRRFAPGEAQFAAVAVRTGHAQAAKLVRSHHWTMPVAYDRDGALGELFGVEVCPMVELAYRDGVVKDRLVSDRWLAPAALAGRVEALIDARRG